MLSAAKIKEWSAQCGPSFYLLDLDIALANYRQLLQAGKSLYAPFGIAYSVKTNYTPALCRAYSEAGALLEVVSEMEYELALKIGHPAARVVVNGPVHPDAFIERVLQDGALINLDSWQQLQVVENYASRHLNGHFRFGLRLMLDLKSCQPSRFGFPADEATLSRLVKRLRNLPNARLTALHCHFCEGARDSASYGVRARQMLELWENYFSEFPVSLFNAGGGFYSRMPTELRDQFTDAIPEFEVYADALCQPFAAAFPDEQKPRLLIEPGNALVADAMSFYCPVTEIKTLNDRCLALLDGSIFDIKPTRNRKNLPMEIIAMGGQQQHLQNCTLTGFTCLEDDVLYTGFNGDLALNDYVVFGNTGAYTNVLRPPFIRPAAAIVVKQGEQFSVAKKPGSFSSVFSDYDL